MTTASDSRSGVLFGSNDDSVMQGHFSRDDREQMLMDDLNAGYRIPALLVGIICIGLFMMMISVIAVIAVL